MNIIYQKQLLDEFKVINSIFVKRLSTQLKWIESLVRADLSWSEIAVVEAWVMKDKLVLRKSVVNQSLNW